jgi:hypothetical protein
LIVINLEFVLGALAVYACQRQFDLEEKINRNVAFRGVIAYYHTLDWTEERSECL